MGEPGEEVEYREETLADDYLGQALDELMACGDARRLGLARRRRNADGEGAPRDQMVEEAAKRVAAVRRRLQFARTSVLFSALAAESHINHFMHVMLAPKDVEALDRLKPPDRFIVGPQVALGAELFTRDEEPMGRIIRLFRLRNELVHPRTRRLRVRKGQFYVRGGGNLAYEDYNPEAAADFLMAVAEAAVTLASSTGGKAETGRFAAGILRYKQDVREAAKQWHKDLPKPPSALARLLRENEPD